MKAVSAEALDGYLAGGDPVLKMLDAAARPVDEGFASQRWLRDAAPKRLIFQELYGDLLVEGPRRRVLDVGGGFTSLTRELLTRHDYCLLDFMAHDDHGALAAVEAELGRFWQASDWIDLHSVGTWDVVIANDLFPNVDQRLATFVERFLPHCAEMRLSLTCYDGRRFYRTRRLEGDEILIVVAWDPAQTARALHPYRHHVRGDLAALDEAIGTVYPNGRLVWTTTVAGGLGPYAAQL
jgi:hypothetical protein